MHVQLHICMGFLLGDSQSHPIFINPSDYPIPCCCCCFFWFSSSVQSDGQEWNFDSMLITRSFNRCALSLLLLFLGRYLFNLIRLIRSSHVLIGSLIGIPFTGDYFVLLLFCDTPKLSTFSYILLSKNIKCHHYNVGEITIKLK